MILAITVVALQSWLKIISRRPPDGKKHAMTMEDAVWWIEWVVTASIALVVLLVIASHNGKAVVTKQVGIGVLVVFLGYSVMPFAARFTCYDAAGKLKSWWHVLGLNVVGILALMASVAVGARPNG